MLYGIDMAREFVPKVGGIVRLGDGLVVSNGSECIAVVERDKLKRSIKRERPPNCHIIERIVSNGHTQFTGVISGKPN